MQKHSVLIQRRLDFYAHRCDGDDRQIDALVYNLYALTPAEIQIVEGAAK